MYSKTCIKKYMLSFDFLWLFSELLILPWLVFLFFALDSLKIFIPVTVLGLLVLIPVNVYDGTLSLLHKEIAFSDIDKLSISNVSAGSQRLVCSLNCIYIWIIIGLDFLWAILYFLTLYMYCYAHLLSVIIKFEKKNFLVLSPNLLIL